MPKPTMPAASQAPILPASTPPTASRGTPLGRIAAERLDAGRAEHLGREELERVGAGADRAERLGRR